MDYNSLQALMEEDISHYQDLVQFETEKLELIRNDDVQKLEKAIAREQALVMRTNMLEKKRLALMKGRETQTFREIIAEAPPEWKKKLQQQYDALSKNILLIKQLNDAAQDLVSRRLKALGSLTPYTKDGVSTGGAQQRTLNRNI